MRKIFIIVLAGLLFLWCQVNSSFADTVYILCQPDSFVNVRESPSRKAYVCGRLELGDAVETDNVKRHGFLHIIGTGFEGADTWVNVGFVTREPVTVYRVNSVISSTGRVACRRSVKGTRRKWLRDGDKVTVYAFSDDWAITDKGFIQTRFLGGL